MPATRISILTYNLWNNLRLEQRRPALQAFFKTYTPDIICLQELCPETRDLLDTTLPAHRHVDDPHPGWISESNIYWNGNMFQEVSHGLEDVAISSNPLRGLFWARLRIRATGQSLLVSTAHFTYQEHPDELLAGQSPRLKQTIETVTALRRLAQENEPVFFMGDLNDPVIPNVILAEAGFLSCFVRLGLVPPPTWPSFPTANVVQWNHLTTQTIDWMMSNEHARPLMALSPHFYQADFSPSDHWPILALYEI